MSTSKDTIAAMLEALAPLQTRARAMFGGHALYCDEKVVALVCDDRCFLKPTDAVDPAAHELEHCPPYPGARDFLLLSDRILQDRALFQGLVQSTADALPAPKPKRTRTPRKKA